MGSTTVLAPAKINLGLEILGKRDDAYHEIRTVMAAIDLADRISITPLPRGVGVAIHGMPNVAAEDNLIRKVITRFSEWTGIESGYEIQVQKRIPSPGGLGGASSDAAATLRALNDMHGNPLSGDEMHRMASTLGSDVPFFLGPSPALAHGTGTELEPLPPIHGYVLLVVPGIRIEAKTPTLYSQLTPEDVTDGSRARHVADSIIAGSLPSPDMLGNAFSRPLYRLAPEAEQVASAILAAGAPYAALSGAGPAHYVLFAEEKKARALCEAVSHRLPARTLVTVSRFGNASLDVG